MIPIPEKLKSKEDATRIAHQINYFLQGFKLDDSPKHNYLTTFVPTCHDYEPQDFKPLAIQASYTSNKLKEVATNLYRLTKNLDYSESIEEWRKFYNFPSHQTIEDYLKNNNKHRTFKVANRDEKSVNELAEELAALSKSNKNPSTHDVQFLLGATGSGKTTFLKYFTKTTKNFFLDQKIITSRVKFREIENILYPKNKEAAQNTSKDNIKNDNDKSDDFFENYVIDCIYRDAISDILESIWLNDQKRNDPANSEITKKLDEIIETTAEQTGRDINTVVTDMISSNPIVLSHCEPSKKIDLINSTHSNGYRFCLILDGFDAISPEEIRLTNSEKDRLFIALLNKAITNNFLLPHCEAGSCLQNIFIVMLVATRPATLVDVKRNIQVDTDSKYLGPRSKSPWMVAGCEMKKVMESRYRYFFPNIVKSEAEFKIFWGIMEYALNGIRKIYKTIKKDKFIDLFNHNTREKIYFLCNLTLYMINKIESQFYYDTVAQEKNGDEKLFLNDRQIQSYLRNDSIKCQPHELNYLLVLNSEMVFENHFTMGSERKYELNIDRSPVDNVFNYSSKPIKDWSFSSDPLLIKYYTLRYIEEKGPLSIDLVHNWIEESGNHSISNETLSFLIRAGLLTVEFNSMEFFLVTTNRSSFLLNELLYSNVYFEHTLLRSLAPKFVADLITAPTDIDSRNWGLTSIVNMLVFLKYIDTVEKYMRTNLSSVFSDITPIYPNLEKNVGTSIMYIIEEGLEHGGEIYRSKLSGMLEKLIKEGSR